MWPFSGSRNLPHMWPFSGFWCPGDKCGHFRDFGVRGINVAIFEGGGQNRLLLPGANGVNCVLSPTSQRCREMAITKF